jgi:twitching motility protein PilT
VSRLLPDPDLESLIGKLNRAAREVIEAPADAAGAGSSEPAIAHTETRGGRFELPERQPDGLAWLGRLLAAARQAGASDLVLAAGRPPLLRVGHELRAVDGAALSESGAAILCGAMVPRERRAEMARRGVVDLAIGDSAGGRARCHVHRQRGGWSATLRLLPAEVPALEELNLPSEVAQLAGLTRGLVLVTGPTGSGKSTTLAALLRRIVERRPVHAITLEDPVEFVHSHGSGVVEHVEIGIDAPDWITGLRSVLRCNPDVLLVGEMRDPESIALALTAAETGHLVLSTLHTGDVTQATSRVLDSYPAEQQALARSQLGTALAAVVAQQLVPRAAGVGLVPAVEVLIATTAVRNLIRSGKTPQLVPQIALERQAGMLELDHSLASLVRRGLVTRDEARARARTPAEIESAGR